MSCVMANWKKQKQKQQQQQQQEADIQKERQHNRLYTRFGGYFVQNPISEKQLGCGGC